MKQKKDEPNPAIKVLLFILKIPYYIFIGIKKSINWLTHESAKINTTIKRKRMVAKYSDFKVIEEVKGNYKNWINEVYKSESQIGIILGSRGSGKTAFGIKLLENIYAKNKSKCYALGFNKNEMPSWIDVATEISEIENNSFVLVDEGGILFSSRKSMSSANKLLSDLILISRHKNLNILFISQNSANIEINVLRQADFIILKPSSLLQKEFERKIIQKFYAETEKGFKKFKDDKGLTYIYSNNFKGFISNPLPSFWKESISKSFK